MVSDGMLKRYHIQRTKNVEYTCYHENASDLIYELQTLAQDYNVNLQQINVGSDFCGQGLVAYFTCNKTDEELEKEIAAIKAARQEVTDAERQEYERLKSKFEKVSKK